MVFLVVVTVEGHVFPSSEGCSMARDSFAEWSGRLSNVHGFTALEAFYNVDDIGGGAVGVLSTFERSSIVWGDDLVFP